LTRPELARWARQTPAGFRFSVKASRLRANRRSPAKLEDRLGPVVWHFMPATKFDREDVARLLDLPPDEIGGRRPHPALEPRISAF
jgi:uncharacterized protein YecE (DUF72 family)